MTARHSLTVRLPTINKASREHVDGAIEKVRHCVIPIIGCSLANEPFVAGSAVIVRYRERTLVLTAKHVLIEHRLTPLAYFGFNRLSRPFAGDFFGLDEVDLVVKVLNDMERDSLCHIPAIELGSDGDGTEISERFYGSVVGFPATQAKTKSRSEIDTNMTVWSNIATREPSGSITVMFSKKQGGRIGKSHVTPPDPYGMSGGAIFGTEVFGINAVANSEPILVGIATKWDKSSGSMKGPGLRDVRMVLEGCLSS